MELGLPDSLPTSYIDFQGLAPLSIGRGRMAAAALGALWGFGHSTGQMFLGLVFALLNVSCHCCLGGHSFRGAAPWRVCFDWGSLA